ncbi:hypothetical protein Tco_0589353 [Tanacetum coccineum]
MGSIRSSADSSCSCHCPSWLEVLLKFNKMQVTVRMGMVSGSYTYDDLKWLIRRCCVNHCLNSIYAAEKYSTYKEFLCKLAKGVVSIAVGELSFSMVLNMEKSGVDRMKGLDGWFHTACNMTCSSAVIIPVSLHFVLRFRPVL